MCGRFVIMSSPGEVAEHFGVSQAELSPRFNVAPTQKVPVVRLGAEGRELVFLRWGLVPSWTKEGSRGPLLINARAETAAEKPAFRSAFKHRHCLIPANGFFEWRTEGGKKQPYYITLKEGGPVGFAGLWEEWRPADGGEPVQSCTILTTEANELVRPLHERMPVILGPESYEEWLDQGPKPKEALQSMLRPFPAEVMRAYPVDARVNNAKNDDPSCITPLYRQSKHHRKNKALRPRRRSKPREPTSSPFPRSTCTPRPGMTRLPR
jgi:putative SOS response-associated peptidase YedK